MTRSASEKNNHHFDAATPEAINDVIDELVPQELPLLDRQFTWTKNREVPTLVRLDRAFINPQWSEALFNSTLRSLVRNTSDHLPLLVEATSCAPASQIFWFEKFWVVSPDYRALVEDVWARPSNQIDGTARRLSRKLKWVRAELKKWVRSRLRPGVVILNCREVISLLDLVEEFRALSC
jgi:hypothetical protein